MVTANANVEDADENADVNPDMDADLADPMGAVKDVEGWFSLDQVARVAERAAGMPNGGCIVEIGSFRGRSMVAIARSAPTDVAVYAIDPHAGNDRGPQEISGYEAEAAHDHEVFKANLEMAGVADRVSYVRKFSHEAHGDVPDGIDMLHIDGAHRFGPARSDIRSWGDRVTPGGVMFIHDAFSSVGVTLAILSSLLTSGCWRYVGRTQSLAEYRRERIRGMARGVNVARQVAQLPWFVRNIAVKTLMVLRLRGFTRLLGHDGQVWPY